VAVDAKILEETNFRIRRDVSGVLVKATRPKLWSTSDDITDVSVVDQVNTGSRQVWLAGGHRKHDGFDEMTDWDNKSATQQMVTYGIVTQATGRHVMCSCTCEFTHALVSKMPVCTFPRRLLTNNINRFKGQTVVSSSQSKCYDANSAMNFQRNDGSTKAAAVVSSTNTDIATILRNPKKRKWLKKLCITSNLLVTRKMKRISVSHGTIAPKRFHMTRGTNNGLRKFFVTNKIQKKRSRKLKKLNTNPITKSYGVKFSSTVITET